METVKKKSIIGLMGALLINNILYMFINTFMVAYFYTLTNYDYTIISVFYIMSFICIALSTLVLGKRLKIGCKFLSLDWAFSFIVSTSY